MSPPPSTPTPDGAAADGSAADGSAADDDAARLYAVAPEDFVAARKELAARLKADGRRDDAAAVLALRKPSAAAWAVNLLARARPDDVASLAALGAELRAAQERLDGPAMRELGGRRRSLVAGLASAAVEEASLAGRPPSAAVREQIEQTLLAAVTDPDVAEQVGTGRLVAAGEVAPWLGLSPATGEPAAGAPASPSGPASSGARTPARRTEADDEAARLAREAAAEQARRAREALLTRAKEAADAARAAAEEAAAALAEVAARRKAAEAQLDDLRERLRDAERAVTAARQEESRAGAKAQRAATALAAADKRVASMEG